MKKTIDAVGYLLHETGLSADEVFGLIETSKGYQGDDLNRWLAGQVVRIAESEGVPFSDILVNKLRILVALSKKADEGMSDVMVNYLKSLGLEDSVISNQGVLEYEEFKDGFVSGTPLMVRLSSQGSKDRGLISEAKSLGTVISSEGGAILYRLTLEGYSVNELVLISDDIFFRENSSVMSEFLSYYTMTDAVYLNRNQAFPSEFGSGRVVVTRWVAYSGTDSSKYYNESGDFFLKATDLCGDSVGFHYFYASKGSLNISTLGDLYPLVSESEEVVESAFVLNINGNTTINDHIRSDADLSYLISEGVPLEEMIVHYGVTASTYGSWGYGSGSPVVLNGLEGYLKLVANCLPIFLFDADSHLSGWLDWDAPAVKELYDKLEAFMSFESKQLYSNVNSFCNAMVERYGGAYSSFSDIRSNYPNERFESVYSSNLELAKKFVKLQAKDYYVI